MLVSLPESLRPKNLPPVVYGCAFFFCASFFATRFAAIPGRWMLSYIATVAMALPAVLALVGAFGVWRSALALGAVSAFGYVVESVGVSTGLPYGSFAYGEELGPKVVGLVPFILPVSYVPLVVGAAAASFGKELPARVASSAALLMLIDGVLDPGAVALGFWSWSSGGTYYGVPFSNYLGWLLSGSVASLILFGTLRCRRVPDDTADSVLLSLAFWVGVDLFAGLYGAALLGVLLGVFFLYRRSTG